MTNISNNPLYLDACASTPIKDVVLDEIFKVYRNYSANPSSIHSDGLLCLDILERSRLSIANKLNANINDVIFTSGATESINLAIKGIASTMKPARIVISNVEHPAVQNTTLSLLKLGWTVDYWPVDSYGRIKFSDIDNLLDDKTRIVSIIWGQSDIGTIQPIQLIGNICRKRGIIFHTDATQVLPHGLFDWGKLPVDFLSASSHKLQGPKGVGILLRRHLSNYEFNPLHHGGIQEHGLRAGTEPLALIAGMSKAISLIENKIILKEESIEFPNCKVNKMTVELTNLLLSNKNLHLVGYEYNNNRLPNHISILVANKNNQPISGRLFVKRLSDKGLSCSTGSACKSGITEDSHILEAIQVEKQWRKSLIRLSLGPWLDFSDIANINSIVKEVSLEF